MGQGVVAWIVQAILDWLLKGFQSMYDAYRKRKDDEKENAEIRKGVEDAQTEAEAQAALDRAAGKLGRRP